MSEVKVDSIGPRVDNGTLTIGAAGDTVNIAGTAGTGFPTPTTGIAASAITTGTMATARLGSGTASSSTFLRGDQTYATAGGTHVKLSSGSASSAVNQDFQSFMDTSKYNTYMVQFSKVIGLQSNTFDFQFLDGSSVSGAGYWGAVNGFRSGDVVYNDGYENQAQGKLGTALAATASDVGAYLFWGHRNDFDDVIFTDYTIAFNNDNSTNGFRVHASGNDATTFDYAIYGITK